MQVSNLDFIERTMYLDGHPWNFDDRPYIVPIINEDPTKMLLMAGRQSEKSTSLSGKHLACACTQAHETSLYVSPTMVQTSVYSKKKIDAAIEQSPVIKKNFYPGPRGMSVTEKKLKNDHTMYFRSAHRTADTIRGITSGRTFIDEIQDILTDNIPVIEECSSHKPDAVFAYSGTPKTMSNPIQFYWKLSNACEWTIKCLHCNFYNMLSVKNVQLDRPGLWCEKCGRDIDTRNGIWIAYEKGEIKGYRLPQIILPKKYISWPRLFTKMREYSTATLMNEVFGLSYDSGIKPISQMELKACCSEERRAEEASSMGYKGMEAYAGIDWASGTGNAFSVIHVGYYDTVLNRMIITYAKRYQGKEADPEVMLPDMCRLINANNVHVVGTDYGFGFGLNSRLESMLGAGHTVAVFMHTSSKNFVNYSKKGKHYVTGRTVTMSEVFDTVKKKGFSFPRWEEYETFAQDFLNVDAEYNDRTGVMKYDHLPTNPDDSVHSLLYLYVAFLIRTKRRIPGDFERAEREEAKVPA